MSGRLTKTVFQLAALLIVSCAFMVVGLAAPFVHCQRLMVTGGDGVAVFLFISPPVPGPGLLSAKTQPASTRVPPERSGQATGMIYMFRFCGGAIGVAAASCASQRSLSRSFSSLDCPQPRLSIAQQKLMEQPGAAETHRTDR